MKRFCIFLGTILFGYLGGWLGGEHGMLVVSLLSTAGSVLGVFAGLWFYDNVLH